MISCSLTWMLYDFIGSLSSVLDVGNILLYNLCLGFTLIRDVLEDGLHPENCRSIAHVAPSTEGVSDGPTRMVKGFEDVVPQ